jgi:hypothetical protein
MVMSLGAVIRLLPIPAARADGPSRPDALTRGSRIGSIANAA